MWKKLRTHPALLGSLLPIVLLAAWEVLSRAGVIPAYQLPAPSKILSTIIAYLQDGTLQDHVLLTVYRLFIGFIIGTAAAILLGTLVGYSELAEKFLIR